MYVYKYTIIYYIYIHTLEDNLKNNNTHTLFKLEGKRYRSILAMKDSKGNLKTNK